MKNPVKASIYLVFFLFAAIPAHGDDESIKIKEVYKHLTDIKGTFTQKSYIKDFKRTDTYKGDFIIKIPSLMRWRYGGEKPGEIIINKNEMIIYQKKEKQAFKSLFDRTKYGQAPIALLSGLGAISEEFDISGKGEWLILKPKAPMGSVAFIELLPSDEDFPIKSLIIYDKHSNSVTIILDDIQINSGVKDTEFKFSLPEGVTIYEYNP